jgi:hypothetical protein
MKEVDNSHHDKKRAWRKTRKAISTVAIILALAGSSESPIKEGTVFKKEHVEAHTEKKAVWMQIGNILTYGLRSPPGGAAS